MNPNLVPTVVVNKNGVTTTVHKKPLTTATTGTRLPAPAATIPAAAKLTDGQRSDMINKLHRRLWVIHGGRNVSTGKYHADAIRDQLLAYPDNALAAMRDCIMANVEGNRPEARHRTDFLGVLTNPNHTIDGNTIHEYLTFRTALPLTNHTNAIDGIGMIRALHSYKQLPVMDSYGEADQGTQEQITALLTVTQDLYSKYKEREQGILRSSTPKWGESVTLPTPLELGIPLDTKKDIRLLGDDLISLILEQPQNADAISRTITEEGTNDSALLREKFGSKTPSLRDGLL